MRVLIFIFLFVTFPKLSWASGSGGFDADVDALPEVLDQAAQDQESRRSDGPPEDAIMIPRAPGGAGSPGPGIVGAPTLVVRVAKSNSSDAYKPSRRERFYSWFMNSYVVLCCLSCKQDMNDCYEDGECQCCSCGCGVRRQR